MKDMSDFFVPRPPTQLYSIEQSDSLALFVLLLLSRYLFLQAGRFTDSQLIHWPCIISIIYKKLPTQNRKQILYNGEYQGT